MMALLEKIGRCREGRAQIDHVAQLKPTSLLQRLASSCSATHSERFMGWSSSSSSSSSSGAAVPGKEPLVVLSCRADERNSAVPRFLSSGGGLFSG